LQVISLSSIKDEKENKDSKLVSFATSVSEPSQHNRKMSSQLSLCKDTWRASTEVGNCIVAVEPIEQDSTSGGVVEISTEVTKK